MGEANKNQPAQQGEKQAERQAEARRVEAAAEPRAATASGTERYVLGDEASGNREVHVIADGKTHPFDGLTPVAASHATVKFPYTGS